MYGFMARTAVARLASNASLGVHFEEARPRSTLKDLKGFGELILSYICIYIYTYIHIVLIFCWMLKFVAWEFSIVAVFFVPPTGSGWWFQTLAELQGSWAHLRDLRR